MLPKSTPPLREAQEERDARNGEVHARTIARADDPEALPDEPDLEMLEPRRGAGSRCIARPSGPGVTSLEPLFQKGRTIELADATRVWVHAHALMPTAFGRFHAVAFRSTRDDHEHMALVRGLPAAEETVPVRVHSECLTGDVLSSLRCDCQAQLRAAQAELGRGRLGALVYLRQEGRGIGLANKIAAYSLQDDGLDTVDANEHLGFDDDLRTYDVAAAILRLLGIKKVALFTNNPRKVFGLTGQGIEVAEIRPIRVGATRENAGYLATKRDRSGHLL